MSTILSLLFTPGRIAALSLALAYIPTQSAHAQDCPELAASGGSTDLYCIRLYPAAAFEAHGTAELRWPASPFMVDVAADGTHRWNVRFELAGLPDSLVRGKRAGFVAWAATPSMSSLQRLGAVAPGRELGPVVLDRFLLLVSAEADTASTDITGHIVLRGESASNRLRPPDTWQFFLGAAMPGEPGDHADHPPAVVPRPATPCHALQCPDTSCHVLPRPATPCNALQCPDTSCHVLPRPATFWSSGVPMFPGLDMLPSEMALTPQERPWLPVNVDALPARPSERVRIRHGDTLELVASPVRRVVGGREVTMLGFNAQYPGPLIEAERGEEIVIRLVNRLQVPTTVHWHGVRLENRFDGVPGSTQPPVPPGGEFTYRLRFPDAGVFWYHPHVREDIQQDLGLYGNIVVRAEKTEQRDREEFLVLDDLLVGEGGIVPYGQDTPTHAAMGRFGNVLLVNGETSWLSSARPGETIRFHLTNVANTRTFNVSFGPGVALTVVGSDLGSYPRPTPVESIVIAPAERYTVDATFERGGPVALMNRVRAIDHLYGRFFSVTDTMGVLDVDGPALPRDAPRATRDAVSASLEPLAPRLTPARTLEFRVEFTGLPFLTDQLMRLDSAYANPVEWEGTMPTMNWSVTGREARWIVRDVATGAENMDIHWRFRRGEQVTIRLINARNTLHGMQHPIHLHGQRFMVLAVNGKRNENPVWKDTVLLPAGMAIDIVADMSNPGTWMLHCHIAEHLQSQMMMHFVVD
jgi:FtsP/CotA-like multicopper oxidase with cupredoxin domain